MTPVGARRGRQPQTGWTLPAPPSRKTSSMRRWSLLHPHQAEAEVDGEVADQVVHVDARPRTRRRLDQPAAGGPGGQAGRRPAPGRASGSRVRAGPAPRRAGCRSRARKSRVAEDRSSRPPSSTTTWSLTRSSSPSRCEVTSTAMPKSLADPLHQRRACRRGRPGRGRWSARRAAPAAGRARAPGRAWPAASCRWSSRPSGGSAPRPARRGAARRRRARARRRTGQAGHLAHVHDEVAGADVGRAGSRARACSRPARGSRRRRWRRRGRAPGAVTRGRRHQAEQDLDQRGLAGAVGADQAGDAATRCRG